MFNSQFVVGDKFLAGKNNKVEIYLSEDGEWIRKNKSGAKQIQNLYFDQNCLKFLDKKWKLSERKAVINSSNMFFRKEENIILTPLSSHSLTKKSTTKDRGGWLKAYQSVKHSRIKSQHMSSVYHMIHALGAQYILNIYYRYLKSNSLIVNDRSNNVGFDKSCESIIFTTTIGDSRSDIFISQFNGFIEINVSQKVRYIKIDSEGLPVFNGVDIATFDDGSVGPIDHPFERDQK